MGGDALLIYSVVFEPLYLTTYENGIGESKTASVEPHHPSEIGPLKKVKKNDLDFK